ncbi:MAG: DUF1559 domain-containing protein, partial [Pirellula sp.]|nr:DUF1559 domain-containing protein [Pirellula sp.]
SELYSFHTGGGNFTFGDGSVRFLSSSTDLRTIIAVFTRSFGDIPGSID